MRIGLLTTSFPYEGEHVAGSFVLGFARALAARGHALDVLAPQAAGPCAALHAPGVRTIHVPYLRPRALQQTFYGAGVPDNLRSRPSAWLGAGTYPVALAAACAREERGWDALISHWALPSALIAGHFAARAPGRPHLAVFHSADMHLLLRLPLRELVAQRIARQATALWFVTSAQRAAFLALLPPAARAATEPRVTVCAMGIDAPMSAPEDAQTAAAAGGSPGHEARARLRQQLGLSGFTLLTLSRLVPIKGLDVAVRALERRSTTLLVAGDGPERSALQALGRRLAVDVRFLGRVDEHQKRQLFGAADAFLMPSRTLADGRSEGVPTALLEAMAHGLPSIATHTGGMPDLIRHEHSGLLVPPDDPRALAAAIARLADDPALRERLAQAGRTLALGYTWPALGPALEAALRG